MRITFIASVIALLPSITIRAVAQEPLQIAILGTAHHLKEEYKGLQQLKQARDYIVNFSPDIICIEAIPVDDSLSLQEVLPNTLKRADTLRAKLNSGLYLAPDISKQHLLAAKLYSTYNFYNAYYHWFQIEQGGDTLEPFGRYQRKLGNSEFGLIVYPAAMKLGINQLYPIDYRIGEDEFLAKSNKVFKKLFFSFKWKPLRVYLRTQRKYKKAEKAGKLMEFINGAEFQSSFSALIDDIPNRLPKSADAQFVKDYWLQRNKIMANRIVEMATKQGATKVLLTVGSAHVSHIKRFLWKEGHRVTTYGDLLDKVTKHD